MKNRFDFRALRRNYAYLLLAFEAGFLALSISPLAMLSSLYEHDQQRLWQLALLALAAFGFFGPLRRDCLELLDVTGAGKWLAAVFGLGLVSALAAPQPKWSLLEWGMMLLLGVNILVVAAIRKKLGGRFDRLMLYGLVFACALYAFGALARLCAVLFAGYPLVVSDVFAGFSSVRFFGHMQSMTLPLLALPPLFLRDRRAKWGAGLLLALWWAYLIATQTRGTWLAVFAAAVAIALFANGAGKRFFLIQAPAAAAGMAIFYLLFVVAPGGAAWNMRHDLIESSGRDVIWKIALEMIRQHPWLGVGPMHFSSQLNPFGAHPHNSLLQWAAEWGLPSALLLLYLALRSLWKWLRSLAGEADSGRQLLMVALCGSIVAGLSQSLVDGVIVMPYSQSLLALLLGWAIGIYQERAGIPSTAPARALPIALVAAALACVVHGIVPEALNLGKMEDDYAAKHVAFFPRFWVQGWIGPAAGGH